MLPNDALLRPAPDRPARKIRGSGTVAIRALSKKLHTDPRVDISLLPVADGLVLALKRP
ncbi:hypothetical protein [Methylococcus sp. Mc7]|uniref:hypothetical protein n=1 Tax=Methylococcus sp. Mc7 TaxID=2860258 RepID=UPI001C530DC0|nr:hypothetical protein [Methylococcus sp. Mc7]QXP85664.1 hypothetical protein KW115_08160 [Methylococcus sp. Mc7]